MQPIKFIRFRLFDTKPRTEEPISARATNHSSPAVCHAADVLAQVETSVMPKVFDDDFSGELSFR